MAISFAASPETSAPPGICQPVGPCARVVGSPAGAGATRFSHAVSIALPPRCTRRASFLTSVPESQGAATQPPGPATGPVGVGESCWGVGRRPRAFLWLAQTRRRARLDGKSLPQQGVSSTFVPIFFDYFVVSCLFNSMSWVSSSTTACATTLVASAARAAGVAGPAVVELSMSSSRRSMRREISACAGMSSRSKSLNALNTGSLNVTVVSS